MKTIEQEYTEWRTACYKGVVDPLLEKHLKRAFLSGALVGGKAVFGATFQTASEVVEGFLQCAKDAA